MWTTAEFHAAINDLPAALFVATIAFSLAGALFNRQSLRDAAFWCLVATSVGAVLAVISGLRAESVIEHGSAMHRSIERHQTLALLFTVTVVGLTAWRVVKRGSLGPKGSKAFVAISALALLTLLWVGSVGGRIVYQHGGGLTTAALQSSLEEREAGHAHAPGTAEHEHPAETPEHEHPAGEESAVGEQAAAAHQHD